MKKTHFDSVPEIHILSLSQNALNPYAVLKCKLTY